jgi:hypothetical protein
LKRFKHISQSGAFFETRLKDNAKIEVVGQRRKPDQELGVICDDIIVFESLVSFANYGSSALCQNQKNHF